MNAARPRRGSFFYIIYVDLVCGLKCQHNKHNLVDWIASERGTERGLIWFVFKTYVQPQLRAGTLVKNLV